MDKSLEEILQEAAEKFAAAGDSHALYEAKMTFLGKTGRVGALYKKLRELPEAERPAFGAQINELRRAIEERVAVIEETLRARELSARLSQEQVDVTMPGRRFKDRATTEIYTAPLAGKLRAR